MEKTTETRTEKFIALRVVDYPEIAWVAIDELGEYYASDLLNEDIFKLSPTDKRVFEIVEYDWTGWGKTKAQLVPVEIRTEITIG